MPTVVISENTGADFGGVVDAGISESSPNTNRGGQAFFEVSKFGDGDHTHAVVRFDGLSNIAGPVVVTSARVRLYRHDGSAGSRTVTMRRLLSAWGESEVTWNDRTSGVPWASGGAIGNADRDNDSALATANVGASFSYVDFSSAAVAQYVEDVINGVSTDYGVHFERTDTGGGLQYDAYRSSEGDDAQRPILEVTYEPAGSNSGSSSSSGPQSSGSNGGVPAAADVWNYVLSNGLTAEETVVQTHAYVLDLARIHGLVIGVPLVVGQATRQAGVVSQSITESSGVVTVTRT